MKIIDKIKVEYQSHLDKVVEHYHNIYHFNMEPNGIAYNNEGDAFKHCYFQAELSLWLSPVIAELIGNAHENRPNNPPGEKAMDLHNNAMGRQIAMDVMNTPGMWFKPWSYTSDVIAHYIMLYMRAGRLITKPMEDK